jgi:hypothetical protein
MTKEKGIHNERIAGKFLKLVCSILGEFSYHLQARALAPDLPGTMPPLPLRQCSPLFGPLLPQVGARGLFRPLSYAKCLGCPASPLFCLMVVVDRRVRTDSGCFCLLDSLAVLAAPSLSTSTPPPGPPWRDHCKRPELGGCGPFRPTQAARWWFRGS